MKIDEAIATLMAESEYRETGETAERSHKNYHTAQKLDFQRCDCSYADPKYDGHEYHALTEDGKIYCVGMGLRSGKLTIGFNNYHEDNQSCLS